MSKEKEGGIIADQIFKRIAALNSDHGPVLSRLVRCLGFLVLYILWDSGTLSRDIKIFFFFLNLTSPFLIGADALVF